LEVILEERHTLPLVAVGTWFKIGSGDERPGTTGLSHFCEHMNFKESRDFPRPGELDAFLSAWGAQVNGYTWLDLTCHFSLLLREGLPAALRAEAQRMHAMSYRTESIEIERGVILAEREGDLNDPEERLSEALTFAAFTTHPYRWPTVGTTADLRTLPASAVREHWRRYFTPENATLVVVGDVRWPELLKLVRRYFSSIPQRKPPERNRPLEPPQEGTRRVDIEGPEAVPLAAFAFHGPAIDHPDCPAFLLLRGLLTGGDVLGPAHGSYGATRRSSRLYRALVETGIAARVKAFYAPTFDPFLLLVTAALHSPPKWELCERKLLGTLSRLGRKGPGEAELRRVKTQFELAFREEEESLLQVADNLGYFASIAQAGKWNALKRRVLELNGEAVREVARKYLSPAGLTVGRYIPNPAYKPSSGWVRKLPPVPRTPKLRAVRPRLPKVRSTALPEWRLAVRRFELSNGMQLFACRSPNARTVTVRLILPAGTALQGRLEGVAELVCRTAAVATRSYDKKRLAGALDDLGGLVETTLGPDAAAFQLTVRPEDLRKALRILFSIGTEATLPLKELRAEYRRMENERLSLLDDPYSVADRRLVELLYSGHPYRKHPLGPDRGFPLNRKAAVTFYKKRYTARGSILVAAGRFDESLLLKEVQAACDFWESGPAIKYPAAPREPEPHQTIIAFREKTQADIALGCLLPPRSDPLFPILKLIEAVLGHIVLMGRLGEAFRSQSGKAYYAFCRTDAFRIASHLAIHIGVAPEAARRAVRKAKRLLRDLCARGVTQRELDLAKTTLLSGLMTRSQTSAGLCALISKAAAAGLGEDHFLKFTEEIRNASRTGVNEQARRFFRPERFSQVIAGIPEEKHLQARPKHRSHEA